jgi:cytoskeletal protein CcmA (bactofilin family)
MFRRDATTPEKPDRIDTVIGKGAEFKGTLTSPTGIRVDGKLDGQIENAGDVIVGEGALVVGNIAGRNVTVSGEVQGNIAATSKLDLTPTGRVTGDILWTALTVAEGARFDGKSEMKAKEIKDSEPKQ